MLIKNTNISRVRKGLAQNFEIKFLQENHVHPQTPRGVLNTLCIYTDKNPEIWGKSLDQIAADAGMSKMSVYKGVNALENGGFIKVKRGTGPKCNTYLETTKQTKEFLTRNYKTLPRTYFPDILLCRQLSEAKKIKGTAIQALLIIMMYANYTTGIFTATKETLCFHTQFNRKTIDKIIAFFVQSKILIPIPFPSKNGKKSPHNRGQQAYRLNRELLREMVTLESPDQPKQEVPVKKESDYITSDDWAALIADVGRRRFKHLT